LSGLDAAIAVWQELPRYKGLAALMRLPGLHRAGEIVYDGIAVPVLARWNRRRSRRADVAWNDGRPA
jgi:hypothetical protein